MAIRPVGYYNPTLSRYIPAAPARPKPVQYAGPTGFTPGYGPGAVPSSAGYQSFGGSTYALPKLQVQRTVGGDQGGGGGGGGGGGAGTTTTTTTMTPNQGYEAEILNDPRSIGAQQAFEATTQQLANTRRAQFRQALIQSGYDPGQLGGDLGEYGGDIDQATRDAAAANQLSDRAQLNKALNQAQTDLPYLLAARGGARSGALPVGQTALQEQYQSASAQGLNDLLSTLRGYGQTYAGGYGQAVSGLNAAREAVAQRLAQLRGYSQTT